MRLKAEIWVKAYLRICANAGASVVVVRHGDDDAGAVFIKLRHPNGTAHLFGPAPAGIDTQNFERAWAPHLAKPETTEQDVDAYLDRQLSFDPDIWIVEVEDPEDRHHLDNWMVRERPSGGDVFSS